MDSLLAACLFSLAMLGAMLGSGSAGWQLPGDPPGKGPRARTSSPEAIPEVLEGGRKRSRRLVLVLHGGSYRPRTPRELAERALEPLDDAARRLGLRTVAPLVPDGWLSWDRDGSQEALGATTGQGGSSPDGNDASTIWASPEGEALVLAYLDRELLRKRVDPDRVYLAGHGAGATAAVQLAARNPGRFAALALWSGTPSPVWAWPGAAADAKGTMSGSQVSSARAAPRVVGLVDQPVPRLADVGVYLWTGLDDEILDREALGLFVARMRQHEELGLGHVLVWETGPGGHDYGPRGARAGLEFLKGCRRTVRR
jgi:pimeloyl-ACP methyl ester carboxylesterase